MEKNGTEVHVHTCIYQRVHDAMACPQTTLYVPQLHVPCIVYYNNGIIMMKLCIVFFLSASYWRNLFDISRSEMVKKSSHWWFHLYGLCSESMSTIDEDGLSSLIESLQQLMESSSVGEYTIKLSLLKTFSAHYTKGISAQAHYNVKCICTCMWYVHDYVCL